MTEQQRQLILEYAKTDQLVNGTVNGLEQGLLYSVLGPKLGVGLVPWPLSGCDLLVRHIWWVSSSWPLSQVVRKREGEEEEEEEKKASWYKKTKASSSD